MSQVSIKQLSSDECFELLKTQEVGRLGVIVDGQPLIFPVNYIFDDRAIVFKTTIGTKFTHASLDKVVFEVDSVEYASHTGWSVVIEGVARDITNAIDNISESERNLQFNSWITNDDNHYVRIHISSISGRRIS